jgi:mannose-6-phosphate isomerase
VSSTVELLRNAVRPYAWGSRTAIAQLQGREVPTPHPEAELWMGAHPDDPSRVIGADGVERSLLAVLDEDPVGMLGERCAKRWHNRLPFLLKVLAADEPMSMQAHPSAEQALAGFEREQAQGIPRTAPRRNYPDPTAKPELVCALTEFHVLAGFRDPQHTVELFKALNAPRFGRYASLLAEQPDADGLRTLFTTLITLPAAVVDDLLPEVVDACVQHVKERGPYSLECRTVLELSEQYDADVGVLAALLLNRLVLGPGEAVYLSPGSPHAYLRGTAVEIQANSDNILRCGLTPKHVDVPELLRVLDFAEGTMPVLRGEPATPNMHVYATDAPEFELSRLEWPEGGADDEVAIDHLGPQLLLCTEGAVELYRPDTQPLKLACGDSAWLPARDCAQGPVLVRPLGAGATQLFRATAGSVD